MKTHAKQFPTFWTGATARQLSGHGPFVKLLADYFFTSPAAIQQGDNYGIYYIERDVIRRHVEIANDELENVVTILAQTGFAFWDAATEWVFVREGAAWQYKTPLLPRDFTCANARRFYKGLPKNPWLGPWFDRYVVDFCLQHDATDDNQWVDRREWTGDMPEIWTYIPPPPPPPPPRQRPTKPAPARAKQEPIAQRVLRRLMALRMNGQIGTAVTTAIKQLQQGDVELVAIERRLLDVVITELGDQVADEAREQTQGYRSRMAATDYEQSYRNALDAAARRIANLPVFQE